MSAGRVDAAARVIHAAMLQGKQSAGSFAVALDSAQMLQSPETAAEQERLRLRVDEVERKYTFDTAELKRQLESARVDGQRLIRAEQRRAELEAVLSTHREDDQTEIERLRKQVAKLKADRADEHDEFAMALGRSNGTEWGDLVEFAAGAVSIEAKLRARVAELEAERHSTNEALDDAVKALREREARLAVSDGRVPFEYVDAHDHRIIINNKTTDARDQPYAWFQAEDLAIGGAMVNVWLPVAELERLDAALAARAGFEFTDHTGDAIAVAPAAEDWTVFTFTRCPDDEDDQEPTTVRVVVLTARVPQLRAALNLLRAEAGER